MNSTARIRKPVRTLPAPTEAYVPKPTMREVQKSKHRRKPVTVAPVSTATDDLDLADFFYGRMVGNALGAL